MYFYKGEFVDDNPCDFDEVYIWRSSENREIMCIFISGTYNDFEFYKLLTYNHFSENDNQYCVKLDGKKSSNTSYCVKLCFYINRHCDELFHYDKEAYTNLVNVIKETYYDYKGICDSLENKFKGGSNIKSAK